jgi:hypothetical protein
MNDGGNEPTQIVDEMGRQHRCMCRGGGDGRRDGRSHGRKPCLIVAKGSRCDMLDYLDLSMGILGASRRAQDKKPWTMAHGPWW